MYHNDSLIATSSVVAWVFLGLSPVYSQADKNPKIEVFLSVA